MIAPPVPKRVPPFTPFKAGAPQFVPALKPIEPGHWLIPDTESHVIDWKQKLLDQAALSFRSLPAGEEAATEAALRVGDALGWDTQGCLIEASRRVSDDLVVMTPDTGDRWRCTALTLTAPTFFALDDVIGRDVAALHGPVPDAARLSLRISRVFSGLQVGQVLERFNWTLQFGPDRHTPSAAPLKAAAATADPQTGWAGLHLRVERQTICKLERTGAILFTIRVCLDPVTALQPQDRPALAKAWRSLGEAGRAYKGWSAYEPLAQHLFEAWSL